MSGDALASDRVRIRVNGEERSFAAGTSVTAMLGVLGATAPLVAVERNREIVPKAAYASTLVEEGDEIEIVEFVGGG